MNTAELEPAVNTPKGSLVFQPVKDFALLPVGKMILGRINDIHSAADAGNRAAMLALAQGVAESIERYRPEAIAAYSSQRPDGREWAEWHLMTLEAMRLDAIGQADEALQLCLKTLECAPTPLDRAKSAINCSNVARRGGLAEDAVRYAAMAYELHPTADWVLINYALALNNLKTTEARALAGKFIRRLAEVAAGTAQGNSLAVHVKYEAELQSMADLPEVRDLFAKPAR